MSSSRYIEEIEELSKRVEQLTGELQNITRPADEVILDDVELRNKLNASKRTTAYWREKGLITFSKLGGKIYYRLSDVLAMLKQHEVPAVASNLKIAL